MTCFFSSLRKIVGELAIFVPQEQRPSLFSAFDDACWTVARRGALAQAGSGSLENDTISLVRSLKKKALKADSPAFSFDLARLCGTLQGKMDLVDPASTKKAVFLRRDKGNKALAALAVHIGFLEKIRSKLLEKESATPSPNTENTLEKLQQKRRREYFSEIAKIIDNCLAGLRDDPPLPRRIASPSKARGKRNKKEASFTL